MELPSRELPYQIQAESLPKSQGMSRAFQVYTFKSEVSKESKEFVSEEPESKEFHDFNSGPIPSCYLKYQGTEAGQLIYCQEVPVSQSLQLEPPSLGLPSLRLELLSLGLPSLLLEPPSLGLPSLQLKTPSLEIPSQLPSQNLPYPELPVMESAELEALVYLAFATMEALALMDTSGLSTGAFTSLASWLTPPTSRPTACD